MNIAGVAPQRDAVELPSAKLRGPEEMWACCPPTQPLSERQTITHHTVCLSSSTLLPQTLGLYRQARGIWGGNFHSCTNHVKGQIVICHSCTNHIKGQILIYHSCTNHIKGQVIMLFIITGVYGDHVLSTCWKSREPIKSFDKQLPLHPHLFCQALS